MCVCEVLDKNRPGNGLLFITHVSEHHFQFFCYLVRTFAECTCFAWNFGSIIQVVTFPFYYFATTFRYNIQIVSVVLGAFIKLRKVSIIFVVCLTACPSLNLSS